MIDLNRIIKMSVGDRNVLWENAKRKGGTEALRIIELIESSGLDYGRSESVKLDSPIGKAIERLIFSAEGRTAALRAVQEGLPPLAALDPLLQEALGADYGPHNEATIQAGYLIANLMRQLGFEASGPGRLPTNCVARTGLNFVKRRSGL